MAATDQEIKKLNKTVDDAVNILKLYVGSSSQIKAKNEKEREAIEKMLKVQDMAEENEKKQRAFTERARDKHGHFIKKREGAWGKFLGMADDTFKGLDKITMGITGKIGNMVNSITSTFGRVLSEIKGQFLSLFGEEGEWFALLASIKDSVINSVKGIYTFIFQKAPKWATKQTKILGKMLAIEEKKAKRDLLPTKDTKKKGGFDILKILGFALSGLAAGIGAWVRSKLMALEAIKFTGIWKKIKGLKNLPFITKLVEGLKAVGTKLKGMKIITNLMNFAKRFAFLGKALKYGFRVLGLPLTILLGVIDFIKGFVNTEGSLFEKMQGGLWSAIEGFIELPVKFLGWVIEKVAGLFGIELEGVGEKILGVLKKGFEFITDFNPMKPIIDFWAGFFGTEGTLIEKFKGGFGAMMDGFNNVMDKWITPIVDTVFPIIKNFFVNLFEGITEWVKNKIESIPGVGFVMEKWNQFTGGDKDTTKKGSNRKLPKIVTDIYGDIDPEKNPDMYAKYAKAFADKPENYQKGGKHYIPPEQYKANLSGQEAALQKAKIAKEKEWKDNLSKMIEEGQKKKDKNPAVMNKILSALTNNQRGEAGDVKQVPDELDNMLLGFGVHNGGMD